MSPVLSPRLIRDLTAITGSIRDAPELSDYVATSIHAHEGVPAQAPQFVEIPVRFLVEYAHAAVEAGKDVFVSSDPHVLHSAREHLLQVS